MQKKIKMGLLAEFMLDRQPSSIRERLRQDGTFGRQVGLQASTVVGVGGRASINADDLLAAARRVLSTGVEEQLRSIEGEEVTLSKRDSHVVLELQGDGEIFQFCFKQLRLLSLDRDERVQELELQLQNIGPAVCDPSALRRIAEEREFSFEEVHQLLKLMQASIARHQARVRAKLGVGQARLDDFMPDSLDYFEQFCGPNPEDAAPEEYIGTNLPEYRQMLLRRDLRQGLEISLIGSLRDDLCPGMWLEGDDDEIWESLQACQPSLEPVSLLAALDIALYRQEDERFRKLAEESVSALCRDEFRRPDGVNLYILISALAKFVLNRLNLLEGGALRPPFWKRMCAWMQAVNLVRLMHSFSLNVEDLQEDIEAKLLQAGKYASYLDLFREPMFAAGETSPLVLRREVIGRLWQLQLRHQAAGRVVPRADEIERAKDRLAEGGSPLCWLLPGPLEGHLRPEEAGRLLPEELKAKVLVLSPDLLLYNLVNLSQMFYLGDEPRSFLSELISKDREGLLTPEDRLARLLHCALVAAAERDQDLAQVVADAVVALGSGIGENLVILSLRVILTASAAFKEPDARAGWLDMQLFNFASLLPFGTASSALWHHLQELKKVTELELGSYGRAEAIASSAAI